MGKKRKRKAGDAPASMLGAVEVGGTGGQPNPTVADGEAGGWCYRFVAPPPDGGSAAWFWSVGDGGGAGSSAGGSNVVAVGGNVGHSAPVNDPLEEIELALREEVSNLRDADPDTRPDWANLKVADAFEKLADNIAYRRSVEGT